MYNKLTNCITLEKKSETMNDFVKTFVPLRNCIHRLLLALDLNDNIS
jgi:hypothetical protein